MRTNRQLHAEVKKYFYQNRTLCILAAHDGGREILSKLYMSKYYETLAVMDPQTRLFFTKLDIQIKPLFPDTIDVTARRHSHVPVVTDPMRQILTLLPNLATIVLSLGQVSFLPRATRTYVSGQRIDTLKWLLECIPCKVQVLWTPPTSPAHNAAEDVKTCWHIMSDRGQLMHEV
jgi:hypothetical protein